RRERWMSRRLNRGRVVEILHGNRARNCERGTRVEPDGHRTVHGARSIQIYILQPIQAATGGSAIHPTVGPCPVLLLGLAHQQSGSGDQRGIDLYFLPGDFAIDIESEIVHLAAGVPGKQYAVRSLSSREGISLHGCGLRGWNSDSR